MKSSNPWKFVVIALFAAIAARGDVQWAWHTEARTNGGVSFAAHIPWATSGCPAAVRVAINKQIVAWGEALMSEENEQGVVPTDDPDAYLKMRHKKVREEYRALKKEFPDTAMEYEISFMVKPAMEARGVIVLRAETYAFTGGAHGMDSLWVATIDAKTGKVLKWDDLFKADAGDKLTDMIGDELRRKQKADLSVSLKSVGFFEQVVRPCDNVYVNEKGIGFVYNPYDVAPFSEGRFDVFFPYDKIRGLMAGTPENLTIHSGADKAKSDQAEKK